MFHKLKKWVESDLNGLLMNSFTAYSHDELIRLAHRGSDTTDGKPRVQHGLSTGD